eukprot:TRINITY_DN6657_c1_g1_i1.p1 TRINITY_DN6657_c1_g1~~TRINITY_DN6657_c1_g1_i1.p1  ORF type:complete len:398 (+),score=74.26 TRINITY_DN6657_c1_g1_i1:75-1268(+)
MVSARRTFPRFLLIVVAAVLVERGWPQQDCSKAPNCTALGRLPCNPANPEKVDNACGNCMMAMHGGVGPANTQCLKELSCGMLYAGQNDCGASAGGATIPFLVPFDKCVCDRNGQFWNTAPDRCAIMKTHLPNGTGIFRMYMCPTLADCATPERSCSVLADWKPKELPYPCHAKGPDSFSLSNGCELKDNATQRLLPFSAWCEHAGMVAKARDIPKGGVPTLPLQCELAPRCPESVLGTSRLEQSCCAGNEYSHTLGEWGGKTGEAAPGFCRNAPRHDSRTGNPNASDLSCPVQTAALGWTGCACLDDRGLPYDDFVCSVDCVPPLCPLPPDGIAPTPTRWLTSLVPLQLKPADRQTRLQLTSLTSAATQRSLPREFLLLLSLLAAPSLRAVALFHR